MNININLPSNLYPASSNRGFAPITESVKTETLPKPTGISGWTREIVNPFKALLLPEIRNVITDYCDIPQMKNLQMVSKAWSVAANEKEQWHSIGNQLHLPKSKHSQESIVNHILETKEQAKKCFPLPLISWLKTSTKGLSSEIKTLINSNKIEDINMFIRVCKDRDAIVFWNALEEQAVGTKESPRLDQIQSIDELRTKAKGLHNWCQKYHGHLSHLRALSLDDKQLTTLPIEIGQLAHLCILDIDNNRLTSLPIEIGQLVQLQGLYVSNNQLTSLPVEIGQCAQLAILKVSKNQLTSLPIEIGQCVQLHTLMASNNQLTSLPIEIGQCAQLTRLDISNNQLTSLPVEIGQCAQLQSFHLPSNQLTSLPVEIGQCAQLQSLQLSNNQLTSLPIEIAQCAQLEDLYVSNNQLTSLPVEIGQLAQLRGLYASNNQLPSLPDDIMQLRGLLKLDVSGNPMNALSLYQRVALFKRALFD